jgi:hypothetical protein
MTPSTASGIRIRPNPPGAIPWSQRTTLSSIPTTKPIGSAMAHAPAKQDPLAHHSQPVSFEARRLSKCRLRRGEPPSLTGATPQQWSAIPADLTVGYVWHASAHVAEVASGLARIGFEHVAQIIWEKTLFAMGGSWYHWQHEPCWVVRKVGAKAPFLGERDQSTVWRARSPKMIMAASDEEKLDHPTQKPVLLFETPINNHLRPGGAVYDPVRRLRDRDRRRGGARPALLCDGYRPALRPAVHRALAGVHGPDGAALRWLSGLSQRCRSRTSHRMDATMPRMNTTMPIP